MTTPLYRSAWFAWWLGLILLLATQGYAQSVQPVPALTGRVIDQTGTLSVVDRQALENKLAALEESKGPQIVILMIPTTQPEDIASYANRIANAWKIGRRDVGDGMLIIVAKDDRRMRIEVAKTLEGVVPDIAAARIIDQKMAPRFKAGDFAGGLDAAVDSLIARIQGEALPPVDQQRIRQTGAAQIDWLNMGMFLFFGVFMFASLMRRIFGKVLGPLFVGGIAGGVAFMMTASLVLAILAGIIALFMSFFSAVPGLGGRGPIILPGGWVGSRHGGGFGGGFRSGGGGNFGGGGASGSW